MKDYVIIVLMLVILVLSILIITMNQGSMDNSNRDIIMGVLEASVIILVLLCLFSLAISDARMVLVKERWPLAAGLIGLIVSNLIYVLYVSGRIMSDMNVELIVMYTNIAICAVMILVSVMRIRNKHQLPPKRY